MRDQIFLTRGQVFARTMTAIFGVIVLVVVVLAGAGIIRFSSTPNESTLTFDQQQMRETVDSATRETGEALENVGERLQTKPDAEHR